MPAKPIGRISMPDDETFFREYVFKRKPVIITNLFDGEEIRQIRLLEDARKAFGSVKLRIQAEYTSGHSQADQTMTFNEYWDFVQTHTSTNLLCTEYEVPARVLNLFRLPTVCSARDVGEEEIFSLPRKYGDHDLFGNLFVANKGNRTHLHWDGDHREVFLYQVFGRKQVILFQPESSIHLRPLDHRIPYSGISLECMSEEQKLEFVDMADGYYATIYPTETIYMPMLIWHYLEYTDHAMSFNIRFGRNKYERFLCVDNFHRDCYIQNFASKLADKTVSEHQYKEAIASVIDKYLEPATNLAEKVKDMRRFFKELCAEMCPAARLEEYCPPEREQGELEKIVKDIGQTMRYADPKKVAQTRPVGPASPLQKGLIEKSVLACGYPSSVLPQLLLNKFVKTDLDLLTKAEAAQFLLYLKSPAASW